ncbi:MAG: hypothetical protein UZ07_CHB004002014, partial [Chlorobi bacterium OLB7]
MHFRKILTTFVLALLAGTGLMAQTPGTNPPMVKIPWNNYLPQRIPNNFQTIIGSAGTYLIPNTANTYGGSQNYNFNVTASPYDGFPIFFLGNYYSTVQVDVAGYIGFNQANYNGYGWGLGSNYPNLNYQQGIWNPSWYSYDDRVLWAYWSDLRSSGVTSPTGGVYYRVDGVSPNRVMTFEWRVMGAYYPSANPGNFQAKIYETPSGKIELFYGPNSINRTKPTDNPQYTLGYGALVGIKNLGQQTAHSTSPTTPPPVNDESKFLVLLDPSQVPDTVAITTARTFYYANVYYQFPELYAYYMSYAGNPYVYYRASPYWHYQFPTKNGQQIGYRLTPLMDDVTPDSLWFTPERKANVYLGGSSITINAQFTNFGKNVRQNVPVKALIYRDQDLVNPVATATGTAFTTATAQLGKSQVTLTPTLTAPLMDVPGIYTVKVISLLDIDQDILNDTLTGQFSISLPNDVAVWTLLQPYENKLPLKYQYPLGVGVPIEVRFLNAGFNSQKDVPVGYWIFDENGNKVGEGQTIVPGTWDPSTFRDINMPTWTPTKPGHYFVKIYTNLSNDQNRLNDTLLKWPKLGFPFDANYEIELMALPAGIAPHSPQEFQSYPDGRPIPVLVNATNSGIADATNVPATVTIKNAAGNVVYTRQTTILTVPSGNSTVRQEFPDFIPNGAGEYCLTVTVNDPQDPVTENNSTTWCFNVKARYAGVYRVGFGEHFRTIQEAWDSVSTYGVGGPVTLELVDDSYTVQPTNNDPSQPALDMRGYVVGLGANNPITWRPVAGKTNVTVNLKSPSGIGIWYGQKDTSNPSGYVTWDGGTNKVLRFVLENTTATNVSGYKRLAIPFYLGQGASNYKVLNSRIEPASGNTWSLKNTASTVTIPSYNQSFNTFTFVDDLAQVMSAGVMLRNSAPIDGATGTNSQKRDTLRNQNNVISGNVIRDFGMGIASVGAGPLYVVGPGAYVEYTNQNNQYTGNQIWNSGRAGVTLVYEKNSVVSDNWINGVAN